MLTGATTNTVVNGLGSTCVAITGGSSVGFSVVDGGNAGKCGCS